MAQIPPPKHPPRRLLPAATEGLAASMRLSRSIDERNLYCSIVEKVAKLYDKHEQRMARVPAGSRSNSWNWFLEEVVQEVGPELIESYEAAWPVALIVKEHRRRKADLRRGRNVNPGLASWTKHMVKSETSDRQKERHVAPTSSTRPVTVGMNTHLSPRPSRSQIEVLISQRQTKTGRSECSPSQAPSVSQVDPSRTKLSTVRRGCGALPRPNTQASDIGPGSGKGAIEEPRPVAKAKPGSVLAFLESLNPPQPALLPLFVKMGVVNTVELGKLAYMARWLYGWVKEDRISEFQFEVIREGLRMLLGE